MPYDIPKMEAAGWKSFEFTLMRESAGVPLLVSDDIIRDYLSYVTTCRKAKRTSMTFSDWLHASPTPLRPTALAGAPV